jgi:hypothetical protein
MTHSPAAGIKWEDDMIENPGFYEFDCNARGTLVYGTPSFDRSTMSSDFKKEIDGISIKFQDGVLYLKTEKILTGPLVLYKQFSKNGSSYL